MRLIEVKTLTAGNKLAVPVYSTSGKIILNAGVTLTESYIDKLKSMGLRNIYIEDERFGDVKFTEYIDINIKNNATQIIKNAYESLHKGKTIDEFLIKNVAKEIVDYVRNLKDKGVNILSTNAVDEYIIEHSLNVAILTAFIGNSMEYTFSNLCDLVTGAIIHDFGRDNTRDENPGHVQKGKDFMHTCRGLNLHSSLVCYEHHENYDGSGYPRKIKGPAISEFTRIIRVADLYDNILHGYEYSNEPLMPHQVYELIEALSGSVVDPDIVRIFRDTIIFYPNGCNVLLSNGLRGIVVKQNSGSPQRPVVRTYSNMDVLGEVDLLKSLTISIKDVLVA